MTAHPESAVRLDKWGMNTLSKQILSPVLLAAFMFALAGTTDWLWGWVFHIVHTGVWVIMSIVLVIANPELLNRRGRRQANDKTWDFIMVAIYGITWILMLVAAALDVRYAYTPPVGALWHLIGNLLIVAGFAITTWSMAVNRHFEVTVRIQDDRDHHVITAGPYRYVRHPGYSGVIVAFYFGMPLALGSTLAALFAVLGLITMIVRTAFEDRTLQAELPGYAAYAAQTRYRLLPGIW